MKQQMVIVREALVENAVTDLATLPDMLESPSRLSEIVREGYDWFDLQNKLEALEVACGALIAHKHHLERQVILYKKELYDVLTKDMAERAASLMVQETGYRGFDYRRTSDPPYANRDFRVPIAVRRGPPQEWVYRPIDSFTQIVPPAAMHALDFLSRPATAPEAFWVADKVEIRPRTRISLDPVLCAQYGRWFVAVAEWE